MPFIPHTAEDEKEMLQAIGVSSINALFDEIPKDLQISELTEIPEALSEMALYRFMQDKAKEDLAHLNYIGAGAYEHHIPASVWEIASRGEWMTAYTPYQAEASQGTLQLLYEYQTMMARLMAMDVSNASLYDGGSALAEAVLMAVRCHPTSTSRKILMPLSVHPHYRQVVKTIVTAQKIEIIEIPYNLQSGRIDEKILYEFKDQDITALVIPQPNVFGILEETDALTSFAKHHNIISIALVNPIAMALLSPPGDWGGTGVDIACGEGQPLGIPLSSGGPYFGFLCCKMKHIRQLPGRLVGRTKDLANKEGFTLTLQAREQHIRRGKATSNICTNQGLLVTAATLYMSLLGPGGLFRVAAKSHANTSLLRDRLLSIGVEAVFPKSPFFHEIVFRFPISIELLIKQMAKLGIQPGFNLGKFYPELGESLLLCATETKTENDIVTFTKAIQTILKKEVLAC